MENTLILVALALFAVVVVFGIFWGAALKRKRVAGEHQLVANRDAAEKGAPGSTTVHVSPPPSPDAPPPPAPPPPAQPTPLADEPVAAAAPFDANPAALAADLPPEPPAPAAPVAMEITQLKGLGPKLAATLAELGFTRIDQIAALTQAEAEDLDARLGAFKGRMARDRWIEQAKLLNAGDKAGYEAAFGKLGG
jgi:predicted flap endonuclease-1-like 5' DNA nuclease